MIPTNKFNIRFIPLFVFIFFVTSPLFAAPIETVTNTNDAGAGSLRQALADVDPGGEIIFNLPGAAPHTIFISDTLLITKGLTITGPGRSFLTINGAGGGFRGFLIGDGLDANSQILISGLTLNGGITVFNGIVNSEELTLNDVVVTGYRNGIFNSGPGTDDDVASVLSLNESLITANSQSGIFSFPAETQQSESSRVSVTRSTISGNSSAGMAIVGPIEDSALGTVVSINKSTISNNLQGIVIEGASAPGATGGTLTVYNSTISNNNGDGIQTNGGTNGGTGATTRVSSSTVTGNAFIGLINFGADPLTEVKNSIISENGINNCGALDGVFTPMGVNFSTDNTCPGFNEVAPADLNLGPLQNNGGPTETHALIPPSVAIDAVTDCTFIDGSPVLQDQRCFFRPSTNCDAGAFEFGAPQMLTRDVPALSTWGAIITVIFMGIAAMFYYRRTKLVAK